MYFKTEWSQNRSKKWKNGKSKKKFFEKLLKKNLLKNQKFNKKDDKTDRNEAHKYWCDTLCWIFIEKIVISYQTNL